ETSTPTRCGLPAPVSRRPKTVAAGDPVRIAASARDARKDVPLPRKNKASSRLVLPAAFAPAMTLTRGAGSMPSSGNTRKFSCRTSVNPHVTPCLPGLQAHRHHDVARIGHTRRRDQATTVRVHEPDFHPFGIDGRQRIEQVIVVEADFHALA